MNEDELLSVIVPIYNMEKYLKRCVESIVKQTYKKIEILLIDDGSIDKSLEIANKLALTDNRIKVFHKENGGLSDAKNYGISKTRGKYITFVDSDDWIEANMYKEMMKNIIEKKSDIAICGRYIDYEDGRTIEWKNNNFLEMDNKKAILYLNSFYKFDMASWDKVYNRKLFKNIKFPVGKKCEDAYTTYKLFALSKKIIYIPISFYHYFQREGSISRSNEINMDYIYAAKKSMEYIKENFNNIYFSGITNYVFSIKSTYQIAIEKKISLKNNKEIQEMIKDSKKYTSVILKNKYISLKKKITFLLFTYTRILYRMLIKSKYLLKGYSR